MEKNQIANVLSKSPVFKGDSVDHIINSLNEIHFQIKKYSKNESIVLRGDDCEALRIVLSGSVRGEMLDLAGKVVKIEDIEAPRPLAIAFLFGANAKYPVDITANVDSTIMVIPKSGVMQLFSLSKPFLTNYLNVISNRTQFLSRKIFFLSFKTIKEKWAYYLHEQYKLQGESILLRENQQSIADLFGVTRPSLARALGELVDDGVLKAERKSLTILKPNSLFGYLE